MSSRWFERVFDTIAERGRELLRLGADDQAAPSDRELCEALLQGRGEASGIALAREILRRYQAKDPAARLAFFQMLAHDFAPDPQRVLLAAEAYAQRPGPESLQRLLACSEPPRQELFRRLNMPPQATAALVAMRADLRPLLRGHPELAAVDADLKHLLTSWFNRGFLHLERISWSSPAAVLEKIIRYESVHAIGGWDELKRRLQPDRRFFAFFHPAIPEEPLIFLEVALVSGGLATRVGPLLAADAPVLDPRRADTAMFYSINNTLEGLRGISFGNFLIKQVLTELQVEFPQLRSFATLSPMPGFAAALGAALRGEREDWPLEEIEALLGDDKPALGMEPGQAPDPTLLERFTQAAPGASPGLERALERLALAYLTLPRRGGVVDPVAQFHLSNGARLERINLFADSSPGRLRQSFGVMVNYVYDPDEVELNHERFVGEGRVALGKGLTRAYRRIAELRAACAA